MGIGRRAEGELGLMMAVNGSRRVSPLDLRRQLLDREVLRVLRWERLSLPAPGLNDRRSGTFLLACDRARI
jgi:hypothetical protein